MHLSCSILLHKTGAGYALKGVSSFIRTSEGKGLAKSAAKQYFDVATNLWSLSFPIVKKQLQMTNAAIINVSKPEYHVPTKGQVSRKHMCARSATENGKGAQQVCHWSWNTDQRFRVSSFTDLTLIVYFTLPVQIGAFIHIIRSRITSLS